jgi:acyl dehydratase
MAEEKVTMEEVKKMVGKEGEVTVVEIEKGLVKKLAESVGDTNPLWQDEEYAQKTKYGGIIASPGLLITALMSGNYVEVPLPCEHKLASGGEWEFFAPIRVGDTITSTVKVADVTEREGKAGKMVFVTQEFTHRNQKGEIVAKSRGAIFGY